MIIGLKEKGNSGGGGGLWSCWNICWIGEVKEVIGNFFWFLKKGMYN